MYEIYAYPFGNKVAELLLYQPGNRSALVLSPKLTREVSKGGSLVFTMTRDHPHYERLQKMSTCITVKQDGHEIWRGRVLSHEADWYNRRVVYCEGALSYFNDSAITPFNYEGDLKQFLQHLIDAHNQQCGQMTMKRFELGTVTAALGDLVVHYGDRDSYGVGEDYGTTWDIMDKMVLKVYGGYAYCTYNSKTGRNVLNYCDQAFEADRLVNQTIEYGVNLLDFTEKTDTNQLFTRVYPMGGKHTVTETKWKWKFLWWGKKYTESHEERYGISETSPAAIQKYLPKGFSYRLSSEDGDCGWIQDDKAAERFGVVSALGEYDTDSDNDTFAAGVQDLQKNSLMVTSYTVKAVDLVDAGYSKDRLTFASYAHIISKPHGVDVVMLCTKLVEPLDRPDKKEYTFGMTRQTLTDRQAANLGKTNLLDEQAATSSTASGGLLSQIKDTNKILGKTNENLADTNKNLNQTNLNLNKTNQNLTATNKNLSDYKTSNDAAVQDAAKTATNFLEWDPAAGLTVRHESLPGKKVQITQDGIKVISGTGMVNIWPSGISITDGTGSCSIRSGGIYFHGIRNNKIYAWEYEKDTHGNPIGGFAEQTTALELSSYSAVLLVYDTYKSPTWFASGGSAGRLSVVLPVNGQSYSFAYPWNTVHWRSVTVSATGITFGPGKERTSDYRNNVVTGVIHLEVPISDGVAQNNNVCRPLELYGFM